MDVSLITYIFSGIYLKDLTFIEEGNPKSIGDRINFSKQIYIHKLVATVQKFQVCVGVRLGCNMFVIFKMQKFEYNFEKVESIQNFLNSMPRLQEQELYKVSLEREPRDATRKEIL